mmetsp:Transcript_4778/g.10267  ORF Transcript_4778/g.10267 Transcript_4778/m.10267 type:complete len:176 (-) Transcript_4778:97-624(-)|eukprot:CAMPEP_0206429068 /NCGR_PEP_ID=MMETSP0324_2-20121206/6023_1 /ASSEMBLY_ACC=CAM_ASM_000836 /TAXON_ID=2866 /ORGANISM="Crypthecodinium cohnii, Strain Seligo" /LENGTH=175 /DNA_ID=CAMNT_0053894683 /DNA_START=390 /DNA_END=917 /DNA_ORIENTATION=-
MNPSFIDTCNGSVERPPVDPTGQKVWVGAAMAVAFWRWRRVVACPEGWSGHPIQHRLSCQFSCFGVSSAKHVLGLSSLNMPRVSRNAARLVAPWHTLMSDGTAPQTHFAYQKLAAPVDAAPGAAMHTAGVIVGSQHANKTWKEDPYCRPPISPSFMPHCFTWEQTEKEQQAARTE